MKQYSVFLLAVLTLAACNESLPLRNDPILPLTGRVDAYFNPIFSLDGTLESPGLMLYPTVRNLYDETLQGYGEFTSTIEIVWERDTSFRRTITFGKGDLVENRRYKYDADLNLLTMDQYDEIYFFYRWDFVMDNGVRVDSHFVMTTDESCWKIVYKPRGKGFAAIVWNPRKHASERFIVSGYIKPFSNLAAVIIKSQVIEIPFETFEKGKCRNLPDPK